MLYHQFLVFSTNPQIYLLRISTLTLANPQYIGSSLSFIYSSTALTAASSLGYFAKCMLFYFTIHKFNYLFFFKCCILFNCFSMLIKLIFFFDRPYNTHQSILQHNHQKCYLLEHSKLVMPTSRF